MFLFYFIIFYITWIPFIINLISTVECRNEAFFKNRAILLMVLSQLIVWMFYYLFMILRFLQLFKNNFSFNVTNSIAGTAPCFTILSYLHILPSYFTILWRPFSPLTLHPHSTPILLSWYLWVDIFSYSSSLTLMSLEILQFL